MFKKILVMVMCSLTLPAMAGTQTWDLDDGVINTDGSSNNMTLDCTTTTDTSCNDLTIAGYQFENGTFNYTREDIAYSDGWGMTMADNNGHSISSNSSYSDMVLLSFDTAINLSGFFVRWAREVSETYKRADITVAAYSGPGNGSSLTDWTTIGHYADVLRGTTGSSANLSNATYQMIDTTVTSKFWLIGAYNTMFTNPVDTTYGSGGSGLGANNDGFKLAGVRGSNVLPPPSANVPEPSTLAIFGLALIGLFSNRRKASLKA